MPTDSVFPRRLLNASMLPVFADFLWGRQYSSQDGEKIHEVGSGDGHEVQSPYP